MRLVARSEGFHDRETTPSVLFVLQGPQHFMLYESVFSACRDFQWFCFLPALPKDDGELKRLNLLYGVRFFSDRHAALANFAHFDAVVTTWAVPHRKHVKFLNFIALAYELKLPVLEFQHGLFQIGVTYDEDSFVIGSRDGAATAAPFGSNLVSDAIPWFGPEGVGYPRAYAPDDGESGPVVTRERQVVFLTNYHWAVITAAERANCYETMKATIKSRPGVEFVLMPHGGELKSPLYTEMLSFLNAAGATNYRVELARDKQSYDGLLARSKLIVACVSTTLLDCELSGVPTVVFRNASQDALTRTLETFVGFSNADELIAIVDDVLHRDYRPELVTGFAKTFEPDRFTARLNAAIAERPKATLEQAVIAIARYGQSTQFD